MGMSSVYGAADWDELSVATIRRALDLGVTLIDTANAYGTRAQRGPRRPRHRRAARRGATCHQGRPGLHHRARQGRHQERPQLHQGRRRRVPAAPRHRPQRPVLPPPGQPEVPLEDSVGALAEGKVRPIGLSEVTGEQLQAAHAIQPVAAVQSEYSLWTRDPETTVADATRELGAGLVAYFRRASAPAADLNQRAPRAARRHAWCRVSLAALSFAGSAAHVAQASRRRTHEVRWRCIPGIFAP